MAVGRNRARVTSILSTQWLDKTSVQLDKAVATIATDIHRTAAILAPVDTGNLVKSGRIHRKGQAYYSVSFGNSTVPYAELRHYVNRKNPQTLKYLQRAGDAIAKSNLDRYLENV